ncbi:hypothetical protein [Thiothrix subterranea]|uniref:hypothetical protein n=1 Tax=Thiothrix subterranea TaxID=2735563 RepID=UPI00280ACDB7|nr:hypothetical protein [Thiothrix subterranea]
MKLTKLFGMAALMAGLSVSNVLLAEDAKPVGITADKMSVTVKHGGESVEIKRNQDNKAVVIDDFAKTSRPCPPSVFSQIQSRKVLKLSLKWVCWITSKK